MRFFMALPRENAVLPVGIGDVRIELFDPDPLNLGEQRRIVAYIVLRLDDGNTTVRQVNMSDQVTGAVHKQLHSFMDKMRRRAEREMLPPGDEASDGE